MQSQSDFYTTALEYFSGLQPPLPSLPIGPEQLTGERIQPTVGSEAVALLQLLVRWHKPARILEIGTSYGFAACAMGLAAREYGGHVTTIEHTDTLAAAAWQNVVALDLQNTVTVLHADAREAVASLPGPFGLILQDGGKIDYLPLLDSLISRLETGGVLVSDDTLFPVMDLPPAVNHWKKAIAEYNDTLRSREDLVTCWLPIGDGISLSVRRG